MKKLIAMLLAALCMCSFAIAEEPAGLTQWLEENISGVNELFAEETLVTTIGECAAVADIDMAIVSFQLKIEGDTVAEANTKVTTAMSALKDALVAQGISEQDIWRKHYDVSPNVVYQNSKFTDDRIVQGYVVDLVTCVRISDIGSIGAVIDAATQSGAGGTHELHFERSKLADAYQTALSTAAQTAMTKAQSLAGGCGMELGELVSLKELSTMEDEVAKVEVTYRAK